MITHLLVVGSIAAMILLMVLVVLRESDIFQKLMRLISVSTGLLIFLGAQTAGLSIPELILSGLDPSGGFIVRMAFYVIPGLAGSIVTYAIFRSIDRNDPTDQRFAYLILLICTFIILMFADNYLLSLSPQSAGERFVLNVSFLVGMTLTLLFNFDIIQSVSAVFMKSEAQQPKADSSSESEYPEAAIPSEEKDISVTDWKTKY